MVKKESAERGYMTVQEVKEHYIQKKKANPNYGITPALGRGEFLLNPKTRRNSYEAVAELLEEQGKDYVGFQKKYGFNVACGVDEVNPDNPSQISKAMIHSTIKATEHYTKARNFKDASKTALRRAILINYPGREEFEEARSRHTSPEAISINNNKLREALSIDKNRTPKQKEELLRILYAQGYGGETEIRVGGHGGFESSGFHEIRYQDVKKLAGDLRKIGEKELARDILDRIDVMIPEESRKSRRDLSSRVSSVIAIAGLGVGIFFLSSNITGNAIADLTAKNTSFIGAGLLIIGLIAGFFWIKTKKK